MEQKNLPLEQLLLDPNNYRLQQAANFAPIAEDRFHLEQVQRGTMQRLQKEALKELQGSILANGFLSIERIVVTPYTHAKERYLVIEGNRRIAALRAIKEQADAGIEVPEEVIQTFSKVPCLVVSNDANFPYFKETLMGIRHVGGIRPWGGYQRAKLIADLRDHHNVDASDVSARLGLPIQEVNRRYRAFKALEQMQSDEEFGEFATADLYPIFHEAVSVPAVRAWLGWDADASRFTNADQVEAFYRLITPATTDDSVDLNPPKIATYLDARHLKNIIGNPEAQTQLLDPNSSISDALAVAKKGVMSARWRAEVIEAKAALEKVSAIEVLNFSDDDLTIIQDLIGAATRLLEIQKSLAKN